MFRFLHWMRFLKIYFRQDLAVTVRMHVLSIRPLVTIGFLKMSYYLFLYQMICLLIHFLFKNIFLIRRISSKYARKKSNWFERWIYSPSCAVGQSGCNLRVMITFNVFNSKNYEKNSKRLNCGFSKEFWRITDCPYNE